MFITKKRKRMQMKMSDPYFKIKAIEYTVISLLILIAICGLLIDVSSNTIVNAFGEHAVFNSHLIFKMRNPEIDRKPGAEFFPHLPGKEKIKGFEGKSETEEPNNITTESTDENTEDETETEAEKPIEDSTETETRRRRRHIHKDDDYDFDKEEITELNVRLGRETGFNEKDHIFLATMTVDTDNSIWGPVSLRNYILFYPFTMEIGAIIWAAILIVFRTGKQQWAHPWMIVVPSIFFFAILSVLTLIYCIIVSYSWEGLCDEIRSQLIDKTIDCAYVLHALHPVTHRVPFGITLYANVLKIATEVVTGLWFLCLLIMVLRCLFVVDFQLRYITVSVIPTQDEKEKQQLSPSQSIRIESSKESEIHPIDPGSHIRVRFEDDPSNKDQQKVKPTEKDVSEDDFHSAQSVLTLYSTNEDEQTSLEPLINERKEEQTAV